MSTDTTSRPETTTPTWPRTLTELCAACDELLRWKNSDWVRSRDLCGTDAERSARRLRNLMAQGFVEGRKCGDSRQSQWAWRITNAGRKALNV